MNENFVKISSDWSKKNTANKFEVLLGTKANQGTADKISVLVRQYGSENAFCLLPAQDHPQYYCVQEAISDRIPRPVIPGEKRELNKRIVEVLAYKLHMLELENSTPSQIWAFRKAAWAVEDLEQEVGLVYRSLGSKGLESIPNISPTLAREIETLINAG